MHNGISIQPSSNDTAGDIINLAADRDALVAMLFALPKKNCADVHLRKSPKEALNQNVVEARLVGEWAST